MAEAQGADKVRCWDGERLVYYHRAPDRDFWDDRWAAQIRPEVYDAARGGELGFYEDVFLRHLPQSGRVLEAGCGMGHIVLALRARGYDCEGVEWSDATVARVREILPELPIRTGDVTALDVPDGHYRGYISLGVIEHRREGPEPFLAEARRVLAPGGTALFSVPCANPLRRLKGRLGLYADRPPEALDFYQYAYRPETVCAFLSAAGFEPLAVCPLDPWKGVKDDCAPLRKLVGVPKLGWRIGRWIRQSPRARRWFGHIVMVVCRKPEAKA